jgi:non-reducing end alpha-L-arabinofuranosidase
MIDRARLRRLKDALLVAGAAVVLAAGALASTVPASVTATAATSLPCDIYAAAGTPCVAAHSTVRALLASYNGPLYQVKRASDGTTTNIGTLTAGGFADAAAQDSFCAGTTCTITEIFDQSSQHNNLTPGPAGGNGGADSPANASALPLMVGGHHVYGVFVSPGMGYRDNATSGVATGSQPQGAYMVASGTHVNSGCCFDYGNAETNSRDNGNGHMDAVYFGTLCWFAPCSGSGPWVQADLENGLFSGGNGNNPNNRGNNSAFVTALVKNNGTTTYAIKGGNADSGGLTTWYSGSLPTTSGYMPMHQEGAIILGVGGDNSNSSAGSFFEGVMTAGYPTDAADDAVQANIVAAGYGSSTSGGNTVTVTNPGARTGTVGTAVSLQISASDSAGGQTLAYSASGLPPGLSINSATGLISGTPTTAGTSNVTVAATDTTGASGAASFTWTIGSGSGGGGCHVSYVKSSEWPGGFVVNITISNTGTAAINGWTLTFTFPGDQKVTNAWNATVTQSGASVTAANASYDGTISPGGSASMGFQGTWTANDASPTAFALNGAACT